MNRRSRILLGASVALLTAGSLHFALGDRFHHRAFGRFNAGRCDGHWGNRNQDQKPEAPLPEPERQF
ncbi:hypothetical protein [Dyadobacter sp. CY343]|jgi:hypothetical protein|uniref:hypothetical protein n=1 Tax=Dyadobacter sp. CY343 TaxID=2907299 RepID=UPI001F279994|nr:hypothetical protein [Dyadobacter sp. CY343]MCE7058955.1 hypothetical protein [Dyadobacter sp. CY343]